MSKYRFKPSEKWAVWKTHGPNCKWCSIPVFYPHCQIDHVLPESLLNKDSKEYNRLKKLYALNTNFDINSFYNWIPIHSGCNQSKSDDVFDGAPFVGQLLNRIGKKYEEAERWNTSMQENKKQAKIMAMIEQAVEDGIIKESDLNLIFQKVEDSENPINDLICSAFKQGFGMLPEGHTQIFKDNNLGTYTNILKDYVINQQNEQFILEKNSPSKIFHIEDIPDLVSKSDIPQLKWLSKIVDIKDDDTGNIF